MARELSIIIPSYNDTTPLVDMIDRWITRLTQEGINFEIIIYNDGSTKHESLTCYKQIEERFYGVKVVTKNNEGHGPTILRGYEETIDSAWVFQIDSDDVIGPENFLKLWEKRGQYDFLYVERVYTKRSLLRRLTTIISKLMVKILYGGKITDTNSPFRLMSSNFLKVALPSIPHETFAPNILLMGQAIFYDIPRYSFQVEVIDDGIPTSLGIKKLLKSSFKTAFELIEHRLSLHLS